MKNLESGPRKLFISFAKKSSSQKDQESDSSNVSVSVNSLPEIADIVNLPVLMPKGKTPHIEEVR